MTSDPASDTDPIWSPDGSQIVFNSNRDGPYNSAFQRSADCGGHDVLVVKMERLIDAPDGCGGTHHLLQNWNPAR